MENIRILFIEDDKIDRMAFERLVKDENLSYDYDIAGSVSETKRILDSKQFDIVIADYLLGDGTAFDILNLIKDTPIIIVTRNGDEEIAIKAMKRGTYDYLIKDPERNYLKVLPITIERAIKSKESEKQFGMLSHAIMNINDSIYITDMDDRIIFVNKAFCKTYGYEQEDIIGMGSYILWKGASKNEDVKSIFSQTIEDGKDEFYHRRKDGTEFPVSLSRSVIKDKNGKQVAVVGITHDVTEYKRVHAEIQRLNAELEERIIERTVQLEAANKRLKNEITERKMSEEKIREQVELLNKAQDAILVRDLEDRILFCNERTLHLFGLDGLVNELEELIGKIVNEVLCKQDSSQLEEAKRITLEKCKWNGELSQITKDGKEVIVESRWSLLRDSKGNPKSILTINTDTTDKKKLESQFLRAQRMESIGTLAGGIAHDLNNMLHPIIMSLQWLQQRFTDEQSQRVLNTLATSAQRGADLVKQVLSFARGLEGERIPIQVRHLIPEMEKILQETFPKSIEISTDIPKDLWTIYGDPTQLHQVIMNLCVNARDAISGSGRLSISAENIFIDENYARINIDAKVGLYVVITVSDTGVGIPPKIMDRIFEPFFTTKEPGKGTGLGLSTAFGIIRSHSGFINVYSEVGRGTRFRVYLPAIETTEVKKSEDKESELPRGHRELVLVADDEASIREVTRTTLETHGYRVITANDGAEAVALYTQNRGQIRVVLMDMVMPIMDGPAAIRALYKADPEVKIIAVSGLKENDKLAEVSGTDVYPFLTKPYTAEVLLRTLHEVLSAK